MSRIFDMRLRPPYGSWLKSHIYAFNGFYPSHQGYARPPSAEKKSVELLIAEMDASGVTSGLIPGRRAGLFGDIDNSDIVHLTSKYPDKFYGLWGLDLERPVDSANEIRFGIAQPGILGISVEPALASTGPIDVDDRKLDPIYETAADLGVVVSYSMSAQIGPDISYSNPIPVQRVAKRFPKLRIVVSHGAWPWTREMIAVAYVCPNVYVSPDQYLNTPNMPGAEDYVHAAKYFLGSRLLYGSSYPSRPLAESVDGFRTWDLPTDIQKRILYLNAIELFGLT